MAELETSAPGPANPFEERKCRKCAETKVVTPETWPYRKIRRGAYAPHGTVCMACEAKRKMEYEVRRDKIAAAVASIATSNPEGTTGEKRKDVVAANKLDVALALKVGSRVVNQYAPTVMARILEYLEDQDHEHHLWALELLAQRILPRKLYEELGGQAAGVGSLGDKRPQFTINILPAQSSAPEGRVVDGQSEVVDVAPEKPEE